MSFIPDNKEDQNEIKSNLREMNRLLSGILAGIALMHNLTPQQLIELAENT